MKFWGAIAVGGFVLSCGGGGAQIEPTPPGGQPEAPSERSPAAGSKAPFGHNDEARHLKEPPRAELRKKGSESSGQSNPNSQLDTNPELIVTLPRDESFIKAHLPEYRQSRYKHWRQQTRISVDQSHLDYAAFLDSGRLIAAKSDAEGAVRIYDRKTRRLIHTHDLKSARFQSPEVVAWPGGATASGRPEPSQFYAVFGRETGGLFKSTTGEHIRSLNLPATIQARFSSDGAVLVSEAGSSQAPSILHFHRRSPQTLEHIKSLVFASRVDGFALSRDNRLLAVNFYKPQDLRVIDLETGRDLARLPTQNYVSSIDFSPDGRWLALGGQGLLLVDLINPERRAYYSYYYNNINTVRFSPSGDALATSSYDGRIRLFRYGGAEPSLELIRTLRHDGTANVYRLEFSQDGNALLSASGDRTVRVWGAPLAPLSSSPRHDEFRALSEWRRSIPAEETLPPPKLNTQTPPRKHPLVLSEPPRPSKIREGIYSCKISEMYKMRECTVKRRAGHYVLDFSGGHLLDLHGVLYDDGNVVRYEAQLTRPSSVVGCEGCKGQALHGVFRGGGNHWKGLLTYRNYYDPARPPLKPTADVKFEEADDRFPMTLIFKKPLPKPQRGHDAIDVVPVN